MEQIQKIQTKLDEIINILTSIVNMFDDELKIKFLNLTIDALKIKFELKKIKDML